MDVGRTAAQHLGGPRAVLPAGDGGAFGQERPAAVDRVGNKHDLPRQSVGFRENVEPFDTRTGFPEGRLQVCRDELFIQIRAQVTQEDPGLQRGEPVDVPSLAVKPTNDGGNDSLLVGD